MITFGEMVNTVKRIGRVNTTNYTAEIKKWINDGQDEIMRLTNIQSLIREGHFYTKTTLSAGGTMTIAANAAKFTTSTAVTNFSYDYNGAKVDISGQTFRIKNFLGTRSANIYEINRLGAISGTTFKVYSDEIPMPWYVAKLLHVWKSQDNELQMIPSSDKELNRIDPYQDSFGEPTYIAYTGGNHFPRDASDFYATNSTATTASANKYITIAGTTPRSAHINETIKVDGVPQLFTILNASGAVYVVDRKINYAVSAQPYEIRPMGTHMFRLIDKPDKAYKFTYKYIQKPKPLIADNDISELPQEYHDLIVDRAIVYAKRYAGESYQSDYAVWRKKLDELESESVDNEYSPRMASFQELTGAGNNTGIIVNFDYDVPVTPVYLG